MSVHQLPSAEDLARSERVHRYVAGGMSEPEMQVFELELMRSPSLQLDVEAELALREHAGVLADVGPSPATEIEPAVTRSRRAALAFAIAASLATGWILNSLLVKPSLPKDSLAMVEITQDRGAVAHRVAPANRPFIARLLTADDQLHNVILKDKSGKTLQSWSTLKPSGDGYLSLIFPSLEQASAPFEIELRSASGFEQDLSLELGEIPPP